MWALRALFFLIGFAGIAAAQSIGGCTLTPWKPSVAVIANGVLQSDAASNLFFGPAGGGPANIPAHTYLGNNTGSSAPPMDLTQAQLTAELNPCTPVLKGLVPAPPNDATKFLDGTCNFSTPPVPTQTAGSITPAALGCTDTNGSTDDTTCIQNAINTAASNGVKLFFDSAHLYKITASLNITSPVAIEGPFRYGIWVVNQPTGIGVQKCTWGLMTPNTSITMIRALAVTGSISGLCIDMTGDPTIQPTAGAAINVTPPLNSYSSGWHIERNTILQPYDGITLGYGAGVITVCCGQSTTADGDFVGWNTIVDPRSDAIGVGSGTVATTGGPGTVGITVWDNDIVCGKNGTTRGHAGVALYEGAIWYDGSQNGPEGCTLGVLVAPGVIGGHSQNVQLSADGVFGDQSVIHDLLIQPQGAGTVAYVSIGGKQPWASATGNYNSVLVDCTAAGSSCQNFSFNNFTVHGGAGSTGASLDIEGGSGGPYNLSIVGSTICQQGTPGAGSIALRLNQGTANPGPVGRWVVSGNLIGTGCPGSANAIGIQLITNPNATGPNATATTIVGNDISTAATPISYTPNPGDNVIINSNLGIDNNTQAVNAAATVTIPEPYKTFSIIGTTTINTINVGRPGRSLWLSSSGGTGMNLGTSGNICLPAVSGAQTVNLQWLGGGTCWTHVP